MPFTEETMNSPAEMPMSQHGRKKQEVPAPMSDAAVKRAHTAKEGTPGEPRKSQQQTMR